MIFATAAAPETVAVQPDTVGMSLQFDYAEKRFRLADGSPVLIGDEASARQWLELMARTPPERFAVYHGSGFGVSAAALIGKKTLPNGAILSEIRREISQSAALCPAVRSIHGFALDGSTLTCTVVLESGEEELTIGL